MLLKMVLNQTKYVKNIQLIKGNFIYSVLGMI